MNSYSGYLSSFFFTPVFISHGLIIDMLAEECAYVDVPLGYLFTNSPFNLVTRLSADSIGAQALVYCGAYAAVAIVLYMGMTRFQVSSACQR